MLGIDVKICTFINGWSGPIRQIGKQIIANVKNATAELRELAMEVLGLNPSQRGFATIAA